MYAYMLIYIHTCIHAYFIMHKKDKFIEERDSIMIFNSFRRHSFIPGRELAKQTFRPTQKLEGPYYILYIWMYVTQANRYDYSNAPLVNNILTTLGSQKPPKFTLTHFPLNVTTTLHFFLLFVFPIKKPIITTPL